MSPIPAWLAARIRTVWPMILGVLAARLFVIGAPVGAWLRDNLGVEVTEAQVAVALGVALGWLIYEAGRALERRSNRYARGAGAFLLSLGLPTGTPVYVQRGDTVKTLGRDGHIRTLQR
jgi:uncharacterized membrane protein YfcA